MSKKHMESSIDAFLQEEGIFEEAQAQAIKEVVAWQLAEAMKKKKISKSKMALLLKTSHTQVDRLLDPKNDITLGSLQRAAAIVRAPREHRVDVAGQARALGNRCPTATISVARLGKAGSSRRTGAPFIVAGHDRCSWRLAWVFIVLVLCGTPHMRVRF